MDESAGGEMLFKSWTPAVDTSVSDRKFAVTCPSCQKLNGLASSDQIAQDFSLKCEACGKRFFATRDEIVRNNEDAVRTGSQVIGMSRRRA